MNPLIFSTSVELVRVNPEHLVFISSDGNYSTLVLSDGESRGLTFFFRAVSPFFRIFWGDWPHFRACYIYNKGVQEGVISAGFKKNMLSNITDNQYVHQNCFRIMKKTFQYIWLLHSKPLLLHPLSRGKDITNEMMEQRWDAMGLRFSILSYYHI